MFNLRGQITRLISYPDSKHLHERLAADFAVSSTSHWQKPSPDRRIWQGNSREWFVRDLRFRKVVLFQPQLICTDGIGLACGIFDHLLSIEDAPRVIAATHFHEIFENDFVEPRPRLQLGHMEVKVCEEPQGVEDQVTYLYKFAQFAPTI